MQTRSPRDIRKLEESSDAEVQAGNAGFGDLNGHGQPDAAVLITFDFGGTHYVQYLVAYVYRQGTYQPAARGFIGASDREVQGGDLEAITRFCGQTTPPPIRQASKRTGSC